eukprot:m.273580 g.273580  ORF g.273580 m.273580 type:complete len:236 (-) comp26885_c1_seq7:3703-4410(-)
MRPRELEQWLSQVDGFAEPKMILEQYPTSAHMAAHMLTTIHEQYDDLEGKAVADLGCGCGVLGIGSVMLGSGYTVGIDIDADALAIAARNCEEMEIPMDFVQCDLITIAGEPDMPPPVLPLPRGLIKAFDTVLMNPPFGTKKETTGHDVRFLERAVAMSRSAVYSLHKTSTRRFLAKTAASLGVEMEVVAEMRWALPATYKVHKKKSVDIAVDFLRFSHKEADAAADAATTEKEQ